MVRNSLGISFGIYFSQHPIGFNYSTNQLTIITLSNWLKIIIPIGQRFIPMSKPKLVKYTIQYLDKYNPVQIQEEFVVPEWYTIEKIAGSGSYGVVA